jgi:hypothetical protein
MARPFTLLATNGAQIIPIPGGQAGSLTILLAFLVAPSAGTVTIEKQNVGSSSWSSIQLATAASISSGSITVKTDGEIGALRVTFASLVGGTSPTLWLSSVTTANPSGDLMTDGGFGPNRRLRVDVGQTGFFAGREFRTFREINIAAGQSLVLKFVVPINVILEQQGIELDSGSLRITNSVGGTPGGSFAETLPVLGKNNMSERPTPLYAPQVAVTAGGTIAGATALDIHRVVAATATAQQSTVGNVVGDERGIAANTYHVTYENFGSGAATGTLWFIWEERP